MGFIRKGLTTKVFASAARKEQRIFASSDALAVLSRETGSARGRCTALRGGHYVSVDGE